MPVPERIVLHRHRPPRRRRVLNWQAVIYHGLRTAGWAATNMLVVLGLFVCFLALLGNLSFDGFFLQLSNLSARYLEAGAQRQGSFQLLLVGLVAILFLIVGVLRWHALRQSGSSGGETT